MYCFWFGFYDGESGGCFECVIVCGVELDCNIGLVV